MSSWSTEDLLGPEGEDWRVPVSELEQRISKLANMLQENNLPGALIQSPVDLYYYAGGRQNGALFIPATGSKASIESGGDGSTFFVRRSIKRAEYEAGGTDCPINIEKFPSLRILADTLSKMGAEASPALQKGEIPADFHAKFQSVLAPLGTPADCTQLIHSQREVKSSWELAMMREGALVQQAMFDSVSNEIAAGKTELELVQV